MKQILILAGPEYGINLGMVARVMKNFGLDELRIVEPACPIDRDSIMYSKHAHGILENAKRHKNLDDAVSDCDTVVGFTGILKRHKGSIRAAIPLKKFVERVDSEGEKVALVFGREGIGLNVLEIGKCDYLVYIESDKGYPVLNLSHAVAVVLYSLSVRKVRKNRETRFSLKEKKVLIDMFKRLVGRYTIRNSERCEVAFRRVLGRANPTEKEGRSILSVLRVALEELEGEKT